MEPPAKTLPANYECLGCLYDMSGAVSRICPECGRYAHVGDLEAFALRHDARVEVRELTKRYIVRGALICFLYTVAVGVLTVSVVQTAEAAAACAAAVCGSMGIGAIAALFARKQERAAHYVAWLRTQYLLNGPWLSAPVSGLIIVAAYLESLMSTSRFGGVAEVVAFLGLLVWLLASIACGVIWIIAFGNAKRRMKLQGWKAKGAFGVAAAVTLLGAMALGIAAGVLCMSISAQMHGGRF